jgi:hypothetical protein
LVYDHVARAVASAPHSPERRDVDEHSHRARPAGGRELEPADVDPAPVVGRDHPGGVGELGRQVHRAPEVAAGAERDHREARLRCDRLALVIEEPVDDLVDRPVAADRDHALRPAA